MVSKTNNNNGMSASEPTELICTVQNYEWGLQGNESLVAQIYSKNNSNSSIEKGKPYAEVKRLICNFLLILLLYL